MFTSVKVKGEWKVLVMDRLGTRIIASCCKMFTIMKEGVTRKFRLKFFLQELIIFLEVVEDLRKNREPIANLEAIYFFQPTREVTILIICYFMHIKT